MRRPLYPPAQHTRQRTRLPNEKPNTHFLSGRAAKGDNATQRLDKPMVPDSKDDYFVDYTATVADLATRFFWGIPDAQNPGLIPLKTNAADSKSLTYTLAQDTELTGFPRGNLFISSTGKDQDFFVYLEEVEEEGHSSLMTEGILGASNRATRSRPFDNGGFPRHPSLKDDQHELTPGVPVKLDFILHPFSTYLQKGHRIRLAINNFDKGGNWDTPQVSPAPTVSIFHDGEHPSSITLPFTSR